MNWKFVLGLITAFGVGAGIGLTEFPLGVQMVLTATAIIFCAMICFVLHAYSQR